ncbi:DUF998 domain-containing protein [Nakamurella flavida]|uniref:DUF998 domain-containing protein n=1 Tax=Nakamurella flavida TaxID=363630 RepID=A0A939BYZ4_9ACTN|nr:DUF998 domain-containing protein [Nakamurella flavida]MBM9475198.1 DUF998 domain-containing protein [Nakamurella flavida]MDP9776771.1 hypothetical protein [Nakamurella flavida]
MGSRVGRACVAACWLLWIGVQAGAGDPLIPDISYSQYGLGPRGWMFSLWAVLLGIGPLLLWRARPVPGRAPILCLAVGTVGTLVMAVVRTDAGGLQQSLQAQVHAAGAIAAMVALPTGIVLALRFAPTRVARTAAGLGLASLAGLLLIGAAAAGVDILGIGQQDAWAFWQGFTVLVDMLLLGLYAVAVGSLPVRPAAGRPDAPPPAPRVPAVPDGPAGSAPERATSQRPHAG